MTKAALFPLILFASLAGIAHAGVPGSTHVLGAKKQTLTSANDTVNAGYYAGINLSTVDGNLKEGNIKTGVTIFGKLGTYGTGRDLPDTGQTICYDASGGVITCPAHGADSEQDGSYTPTAPSYTDNGDYTITDNITGLMWKKCSEGQNNDSTCTGTAVSYTWANALSQCTGLITPGYADWRLPNIKELMSIADYGTADPTINGTYFPNTVSAGQYYWSSTTEVYVGDGGPATAWGVGFRNGTVYHYSKSASYYVRCVR